MDTKSADASEDLARLAVLDAGLHQRLKAKLSRREPTISPAQVRMLVEETMWGVAQEVSFGHALADGFLSLLGEAPPDQVRYYRQTVRAAGAAGPTLGRLTAQYLAPVIKSGDKRLRRQFGQTLQVMTAKGNYTLPEPLKALQALIEEGQTDEALGYLKLLEVLFSADLTYTQSQHMAAAVPKAVLAFAPHERGWLIDALKSVAQIQVLFVEPFLKGFEKGLYLLDRPSLQTFISRVAALQQRDRDRALRYCSLDAYSARDAVAQLQVAVPLDQALPGLNRYARARTGKPVKVRSARDLSLAGNGHAEGVFSDGITIYLPSRIRSKESRAANMAIYKCMVKLETATIEFGTFDFDDDRFCDAHPELHCNTRGGSAALSHVGRFLSRFPIIELANDLMVVFEHGRQWLLHGKRYPGLVRELGPLLQDEARRLYGPKPAHPLQWLYWKLAVSSAFEQTPQPHPAFEQELSPILDRFYAAMASRRDVHTVAELVVQTFALVQKMLQRSGFLNAGGRSYRPLETPFNRKLLPECHYKANAAREDLLRKVRSYLAQHGIDLYVTDLRRILSDTSVLPSAEAVEQAVKAATGASRHGIGAGDTIDFSDPRWRRIFPDQIHDETAPRDTQGPVHWYGEWDHRIGDYLPDHVRVLNRTHTQGPRRFYDQVLLQHRGLVEQTRYAFEILKPQRLAILRQWIEGDDFDHRALIDFAVDRRAHRSPSERLYIKRLKQERDVAVLLLVDLSRSTDHAVSGAQKSVLEVEKEALVLFCEALQVVGDKFAIGGFSGVGRLNVDFWFIKRFQDPLEEGVKRRIAALTPQRNTRMGAAVRHAAAQLAAIEARVKLLIILGDGFPNDAGYKKEHAVEDTRRAIQEACSRNIHTHGITINIAADPQLDDLYGETHHNVISDVRELPDKLVRIYGSLTG